MKKKAASTELFITQVQNHAEMLGGLIGLTSGEAIAADLINRCIVSTNMLANSASLMELTEWETFLKSWASLLTHYRDKHLRWEERIAQLTSELIEREEEFVSVVMEKGPTHLQDVADAENFQALSGELEALLTTAGEAEPVPIDPPPSVELARDIAIDTIDLADPEADPVEPAQAAGEAHVSSDHPLGRSLLEMNGHVQRLLEDWESAEWDFNSPPQSTLEAVRKQLRLIDFYARSIETSIRDGLEHESRTVTNTLRPIRVATQDFAAVRCSGSNRRIDISFLGEERSLDVALLSSVKRILQSMINDVFLRCEDRYLRIEIEANEKYGVLRWNVRDNGDNFITDSRLDPDDFLAFYPGLKASRRVLAELDSLLWVEPDENHDTRFAFTTPASLDGGRFMVWGEAGERFAVFPQQLSQVFSQGEVDIKNDSRGEHILIGGRRVPVLRLGHVYRDAPSEGDRIAVIGCLERRVAFYVQGKGQIENGTWQRDAVPAWKGMTTGVAKIGKSKVPLLRADSLLKTYYGLMAVADEQGVAGGAIEEPVSPSRRQADPKPVRMPGPEAVAAQADRAEILIVERSEDLRNTFATIFSQSSLKAQFVDEVETALKFIHGRSPSLIISEFRVPSMAAKILVETLKSQGKSIPVLVTTSHHGESADLLVEQLGVSGYLSKPLNADEVLTRITGHLRSAAVPGRSG
jgi:CheY-like chemotaxis protein